MFGGDGLSAAQNTLSLQTDPAMLDFGLKFCF
jgi:hypothetical protein